MNVRDAVAFVTGANRGLGLVFAQELLAAGARKVYAAARHPERITLAGVAPVRLDVTIPGEIAASARECTGVNRRARRANHGVRRAGRARADDAPIPPARFPFVQQGPRVDPRREGADPWHPLQRRAAKPAVEQHQRRS